MITGESRIALVGYTGLVGTILNGQLNFTDYYNSKNIQDIRGQHFDAIYFSAIPAEKYKANQDPERDLAVVNALIDVMSTVTADLFVLISTIDVYQLGTETRYTEESDLTTYINTHHAYGKHRFFFEEFVKKQFARHLIARLPALHGPNLKKNYIYDLLKDNGVDRLKRNTCFQWYDLTRLSNDLQVALDAGLSLVNLFPAPVWTHDLLRIAAETRAVPEEIIAKVPAVASNTPDIIYKIYTRHGALYGGDDDFMYSEAEAHARLRTFFLNTILSKKLAISNISWDWNKAEEHDAVIRYLKAKYNVKKIEVAPTKIWGSWDNVKAALADGRARKFGELLRANDIVVPSYQAILFACPEAHLLKDDEGRRNFIEHTKFIIDLAATITHPSSGPLRAPALVMGAPKNRLLFGLTHEQADPIAIRVFKELGDYAHSKNVVVALEANPAAYACEYLNNSTDAARMVRLVNSPGFKLHVDVACMFLANDDIAKIVSENKDVIYHVHISEPFLAAITPDAKSPHALFREALEHVADDVVWSIEMRDGPDNVAAVKTAVDFVAKTYFDIEY